MKPSNMYAVVGVSALSMLLGACTEAAPTADKPGTQGARTMKSALEAGHSVVSRDASGKPDFVLGDLGSLPPVALGAATLQEAELAPAVSGVAPLFQLKSENLFLKRAYVDPQGDAHYRYGVRHNGLLVLGAEVRLHARDGKVFAANTNVRGDLPAPEKAAVGAEAAVAAAASDRGAPTVDLKVQDNPELVYWRDGERLVMVYEVMVTGEQADGTPVRNSVLVDAVSGDVIETLQHVHTALNRKMYDGKTLSTLPGTLARTEGQAPVADSVVNTNYDHLGAVYNCYAQLFGRDSYTNTGAALISTVHHRVKYVNAFWNGTQMVYGDGDGVNASNLANSLDVTAHELTHAVTDSESDLIYSGESGGLNESMSDIFGAVCEWHGTGKVLGDHIWKIGDDVWTPSIPGDALRYMNSPTLDGDSLDYYPDYVSGVDVHYSSGISNLAFYLLSQGGKHPRGKTTTEVAGIGIEKAARIFYKANVDLLMPSSTFEAAKVATEQAAAQLGYDAATIASVSNAWKAVGVGVPVPPPPNVVLGKDQPATNLSGSRGQKAFFSVQVPEGASELTFTLSGGTGDADLYVKFGQAPTTASYDCRPYKSGNNEVCSFPVAREGTYYVMLNAFSNYAGASLSVTWKGGYIPVEPGTSVTEISGKAGDSFIYTVQVPEGVRPKFSIGGGSGNADIYVKLGSAPTHSSYTCRDVKEHNEEHCNQLTASGKYYVMVFGAQDFGNVTLKTEAK